MHRPVPVLPSARLAVGARGGRAGGVRSGDIAAEPGVPRLGDGARARSWIEKAVHLHPEEAGVLINAGCLFAKMGDKERALETLEKAFARGQGKRDSIDHDPGYDSLRDDPRFQALLEKLP